MLDGGLADVDLANVVGHGLGTHQLRPVGLAVRLVVLLPERRCLELRGSESGSEVCQLVGVEGRANGVGQRIGGGETAGAGEETGEREGTAADDDEDSNDDHRDDGRHLAAALLCALLGGLPLVLGVVGAGLGGLPLVLGVVGAGLGHLTLELTVGAGLAAVVRGGHR